MYEILNLCYVLVQVIPLNHTTVIQGKCHTGMVITVAFYVKNQQDINIFTYKPPLITILSLNIPFIFVQS